MSRFLIKKQSRNRGSTTAEPSGKNSDKIIVALDTNNLKKAKILVKTLWPRMKFFKIGLEMINTGQAPELTRYIKKLDGKVFYDAKLNDIPNTMAKATMTISKLGVDMISIHASTGKQAMQAVVRNKGRSKIMGVTVLTSIDDKECRNIFGNSAKDQVLKFADMLVKERCDGIVCSPQELKFLRKMKRFSSLEIATPGIRPTWADRNEQKRITTPRKAIEAGADYLVIGRPITDPLNNITNPKIALDKIIEEIEN